MNLGPAGRLGRFFIDSKLTPLLLVSSLALGAVAVTLTPREEEPQIVVPVVDLFVGLPGASPEEVEARGTIPLEKRMWEIPGVEYVYSASMPGLSLVTVRFRVGDNEVDSLVKVFEKLTSGMERMQEGFTTPLAKLRGIDDVPVLALTLWGRNADGFALRRLAAELEREVPGLDEVSETRRIGGRRRDTPEPQRHQYRENDHSPVHHFLLCGGSLESINPPEPGPSFALPATIQPDSEEPSRLHPPRFAP